MAGIIFWIIIVIWIVATVSKNKKPTGNGGQKGANRTPVRPAQSQNNRSKQSYDGQMDLNSWAENNQKQQELKQRLTKKYNKKTEGDILGRARASVEEDFSEAANQKPQVTQDRQKEMERKIAEKLAAAEHAEALLAEEENVLGSVEDLMVKGPSTELPFQRDFLSEGMDMLNRIQV